MIEQSRFEGNEIITTGDQNNTATRAIENLDFAFSLLGADQIIFGFIVEQTGTPSMGVKVSPGGIYDSENEKFLYMDSEVNPLSISESHPSLTRRDIIQVRRTIIDYNPLTRQFKDPETKDITSATINTKLKYTCELSIVEGVPGNNAPNPTAGWKKIAEIHLTAGATTVTNAMIKNCDAPLSGEVNTGWTTDTMLIYRQGTISELKQFVIDSIPEARMVTNLIERTTLQDNDIFYLVNPSGVTAEQIDLRTKVSTIKTKIRTDELTGTATKLVKFKTGGGVEGSLTISDVVVGAEVNGTSTKLAKFRSSGRGVEDAPLLVADVVVGSEVNGTSTKLAKFRSSGRGVEDSPLLVADVVVGSEVTGTAGNDAVFVSGGRGVENGASFAHATNTGSVTNSKTRQVNASNYSTASGTDSQVNASYSSTASGADSQVNASNYSTASGIDSQVNASYSSTASGNASQVNASYSSTASGTDSQVNASRATASAISLTVCGGYSSGSTPLTSNRKWQLESQTGNIYGSGTVAGGYTFSDYKEMFENLEKGEILPGYIITMVDDKVKVADGDDYVLGVCSRVNGGFMGGDSPFCWSGRYLIDEFGRYIQEQIEIEEDDLSKGLDEKGKYPKIKKKIIANKENPEFDPSKDTEYVKRSDRPESWTPVGMLGQIPVRTSGTIKAGMFLKPEKGIGVKSEIPTGIRTMRKTGENVWLCVVK